MGTKKEQTQRLVKEIDSRYFAPMAKTVRKIGVGDTLTILVKVIGAGVVDGRITIELNGQKQTIPEDLEAIIDVTPYDPSDVYKRVR
jgi:hypothetical protein